MSKHENSKIEFEYNVDEAELNNIGLPEVNTIIKNLIKKQFRTTKNKNKIYRCNACSQYFPDYETDLYKYKSDSKRTHRVCLKCIKKMSMNLK